MTTGNGFRRAPHHLSIVGALVVAAGLAVFLACNSRGSTGDDLGGSPVGSSSSGGNGTGLDAAVPEGVVDCGAAPNSAGVPFTKGALLGAIADCASWHTCNFQNAATGLRTAVRAQAEGPSDERLAAARDAWKKAMNEWSKLELFQFGPVASKGSDPYQGRGLRAFVHPWPDVNRCQVETQVALKSYEQGWNAVFASGRGLHAVEYALFFEGVDTACAPNAQAAKTWATLAPEQIAQGKRDYAVAVVDNLAAIALELSNVWSPAGEDFKRRLLAFDKYGSEQETLNVAAWSLLYLEVEVKDFKLGGRSGIQELKAGPETPFGHVEVDNVRTNARAFRSLFQGCGDGGEGLGFDDWLVSAGQGQLSSDILRTLADFQAAADAFPSFETATQEQFVTLYNTLKPLTDLLKTSLFGSASPLNLKLPASAASDTD